MRNFKLYMAALLAVGFASFAFADGYDLAYKNSSEFPTTTTAPASSDKKLIFVAADNKWELFGATVEKLTGSFNGTVGATTPAAGTFTTLTASGVAALNGANTSTGSLTYTRTPSADSATTNQTSKIALTAPVDTTGTNTHQGYDVALTVSNATGGTNTVNGYTFDNYTGDAQVNVNAIKIGTSDGLGTAYALNIGSGWDRGISTASPVVNTYAAGADSGLTNNSSQISMTVPVDTTGTNTHNLLDLAPTISNSTGGTNKVNALAVENVTGDAQVDVTGLRIGTGTTLGTSNGIVIGSGWDAGIVTDSGVQINSTNGTLVTAFRVASDTVASGQTTKTVTVTGATASSKCVAQANEVPTNAVYIKSAAPGTDQVVITTSGDPGGSNLDLTVMCVN